MCLKKREMLEAGHSLISFPLVILGLVVQPAKQDIMLRLDFIRFSVVITDY